MSIQDCLTGIPDDCIRRGRLGELTQDDISELEEIINACDDIQEMYKDFNLLLAEKLCEVADNEKAHLHIAHAATLERLNKLVEYSDALRKDATFFIINTTKKANAEVAT